MSHECWNSRVVVEVIVVVVVVVAVGSGLVKMPLLVIVVVLLMLMVLMVAMVVVLAIVVETTRLKTRTKYDVIEEAANFRAPSNVLHLRQRQRQPDCPCFLLENSLHRSDRFTTLGKVSKSCASSAECGPSSVGCIPVDTQQICISCCDLSYCNIESPTNSTNAIYSRKRRAKSKSKRKRPGRNGVEGTDSKFYGSGVFWLLASIFYAYHC
ncbi:hypothetical protein HZH68_000685 [Vespula germanica]|uniref:Uncharacterized protein n=1 Tax=Vespula germanica TaxID=30212 RepID=A0A834NU88_VESGE|nr:hypothetical protein HZH68_000685 [Vespula germanica]